MIHKMEKLRKNKILKIIKFIFMILWMAIVFYFSNQPGKMSSDTSSGFTEKIIKIVTYKSDLTDEEKENIVQKIEPITRKFAHYTLYTIGGILIINVVNEYKLKKAQKNLISLIIGNVYAITDEIHQYFIEGRSASICDVGIDTLGVITGIAIFLLIMKFIKIIKNKIS